MYEVHFALTIANSKYQDSNLRKLLVASLDAEALAKVLRDPEIGEFDLWMII